MLYPALFVDYKDVINLNHDNSNKHEFFCCVERFYSYGKCRLFSGGLKCELIAIVQRIPQ
jgi:hypothetical protein